MIKLARPKKKVKETKTEKSYEKSNKISPLKLFCIIVNRGQGDFFLNEFNDNKISCSFDVYGKGTAPKEIYDILGVGDTKKDLIISIVKSEDMPKVKKIVEDRFNVSKKAKGIGFSIPMDSIAGVVVYKFLTNNREIKKGE